MRDTREVKRAMEASLFSDRVSSPGYDGMHRGQITDTHVRKGLFHFFSRDVVVTLLLPGGHAPWHDVRMTCE